VSGLTNGVAAIDADGVHTCAVTTSGGVQCWGDNDYGQLGDETAIERHTPVAVSGLTSGVVTVALGKWYSCALTNDGGVRCLG
jgi:alpha-tubulin suppressor-like RCC1 family protein